MEKDDMISQTLQEAREYEAAAERNILEDERPSFHLSPRTGWMNDPNGFCLYKGRYHMFYQYYPYATKWGPMHWGHAVSNDLLHWEYLPAALAPDMEYDQDGCFSGNALELPDGRMMLVYTGVRKEYSEDDLEDKVGKEVQTQCLAVGDGIDFEKSSLNPVLDEKDIPAGCSRNDFRDPKPWRCEDGSYRCVVGNRDADGSGQILLYKSDDAWHWHLQKILAQNHDRFGKMWECPDFFPLDGKQVLLTSPQDMLPKGFEYHNGNGTLCLIGSFDPVTEEFREESDQAIDYGIDFYAPQTIQMPDGRRVMIGWMQNWDTCVLGTRRKWQGQMSVPRELSIKNGRLYQAPLRELSAFRANKAEYRDVLLEGEMDLPDISGRVLDMEIVIRPEDPDVMYQKFSVHFAKNDQYHTTISYRPQENVLKIDRKFSGSRRAFIHQRRSKVAAGPGGVLKLRLILDRYSAEVFVNDGEQVMTAIFYTPLEAKDITFAAAGRLFMDVVKYDLIL